MESWYTKLFSMTLVKVKMHLEGLNGWNEIVKPKKLKVIVWQRKLESHLTFFSKPNKTCNYQYCKWWLYIISNQPQQSAVQNNLISATHFGDGTDLRRSPLGEGTHTDVAQKMWKCFDTRLDTKRWEGSRAADESVSLSLRLSLSLGFSHYNATQVVFALHCLVCRKVNPVISNALKRAVPNADDTTNINLARQAGNTAV